MKTFLQHIRESNNVTNMTYIYQTGAGFAIDRVASDFDVEDWPEGKKKMKPWEVRNAEDATTRRTHLLRWMKAVSDNKEEAVNSSTLPLTPKWQSRKR